MKYYFYCNGNFFLKLFFPFYCYLDFISNHIIFYIFLWNNQDWLTVGWDWKKVLLWKLKKNKEYFFFVCTSRLYDKEWWYKNVWLSLLNGKFCLYIWTRVQEILSEKRKLLWFYSNVFMLQQTPHLYVTLHSKNIFFLLINLHKQYTLSYIESFYPVAFPHHTRIVIMFVGDIERHECKMPS